MIKSDEVINIRFSDFMLETCHHFAKELYQWQAPSLIFGDKQHRQERKYQDSLTGMICEAAAAFWLGRYNEWVEHRTYAAVRNTADNGFDLPGTIIDVKGRKMHAKQPDPLAYKLYVRQQSSHKEAVFMHVVADYGDGYCMAHLIGWVHSRDLDDFYLDPFGKYRIGAHELNPIPQLFPLS